jgi:hypothetical protein
MAGFIHYQVKPGEWIPLDCAIFHTDDTMHNRMGSLYRSGHIQSIAIRANATPADVDNAVKDAFIGVAAVEDSENTMDGWRLLFKVARGKRHMPYLHPHKDAGDVTAKDLEWSVLVIDPRSLFA